VVFPIDLQIGLHKHEKELQWLPSPAKGLQ